MRPGQSRIGCYDLTNNSGTPVTITVGDREFSPVAYGVSYGRQIFEYQWEEQTPYYTWSERESGKNESLHAIFQMQPYLKFPFQNIQLQVLADGQPRADIEVGPIEADYVYTDGYYDGHALRKSGKGNICMCDRTPIRGDVMIRSSSITTAPRQTLYTTRGFYRGESFYGSAWGNLTP